MPRLIVELPRRERHRLHVEQRLVRERRRPEPADGDAVQAAAQLDVHPRVEQILHGPIHLTGPKVARTDDRAGGAQLGDAVARVDHIAVPVLAQPVSVRLVLVADETGSPVPELGMLRDERSDLGRFVTGTDEHDRPEIPAGPTPGKEPLAIAAPCGGDEHECERGADEDLPPGRLAGHRGDRERDQPDADAASGQSLVLEHAYRADSRLVQADRVEEQHAAHNPADHQSCRDAVDGPLGDITIAATLQRDSERSSVESDQETTKHARAACLPGRDCCRRVTVSMLRDSRNSPTPSSSPCAYSHASQRAPPPGFSASTPSSIAKTTTGIPEPAAFESSERSLGRSACSTRRTSR